MRKMFFLKRWFYEPEEIIENNGLPECEFTSFPWEVGTAIITPMKSGKKAMFNVVHAERPSDPGDQVFYDYEFVKYV